MLEKIFPQITELNSRSLSVLKLQIILILLLLNGFVYSFFSVPAFYAQIVFNLLYLKVFFKALNDFRKDRNVFIAFFLFLLLAAQSVFLMNFFKIQLLFASTYLIPFLVFLLILIFFFKMFYSKKFIEARVLLSDEKLAVIETELDLNSLTVSGKFIVKSNKKFKKGRKVKVAVKKGFFSSRPDKIIN